jgi:hypothetical protein
VEGIHVFVGRYAKNDLILVKMLGEGELTKYAVYTVVSVELVNKSVKLLLGGGGGKLISLGVKSDLLTGSALVAHVHLRCGIVANNNYRKSRAKAVLRRKLLCFCLYFTAYLG